MSEDKRKRSPNWLTSEKDLLLNLVECHYSIIETKQTDGFTVKAKLAQWQIMAEQYNSRTNHCSRTGENLKAQWESMKKTARKVAANRKLAIQTGVGPPEMKRHTKEDPFIRRILTILSINPASKFNPYDSDSNVSAVPTVQDQPEITVVIKREVFPEPSPIQNGDILVPPMSNEEDHRSDTVEMYVKQELVEKDWDDYTPQMSRTPVSDYTPQLMRTPVPDYTPQLTRTPVSLGGEFDNEQTPNNKKRVFRRRPTHTNTSLEQLHKKKIEAIELQKKVSEEEIERSKVLHDLDIQIKQEILRQEKIKTSMLLIRRRKLLTKKQNMKSISVKGFVLND